jgi:hypothetical protein
LRSSLYKDDAAIFVALIKEDIVNLSNILEGFSEVTELFMNFQRGFVNANSVPEYQP